MAHEDFRGTPTYFTVFKMLISSKNVNQNMLKVPYFLKKICKNSPSSGQLEALTPDSTCDLTHTCPATKRFKFVAIFNEGFKEKILVKSFFWRTCYTFENILY